MATFARRRRSHSTSTSACHPATKRSLPCSPVYPDFSSPHKWDVDVWRGGKRPRHDIQPSSDLTITRSQSQYPASASSAPSTPKFPTTAAEFHLFPNHGRKNSSSPRRSTSSLDPLSSFTFDIDLPHMEQDLSRLRSKAFWDLHRSVAESGECLVRRMRNFEDSRSRSGLYTTPRTKNPHNHRGRKRISPVKSVDMDRGTISDDENDDAEDIQIFAGGTSDLEGSPRKKRAFSLGLMDASMSHNDLGFHRSERRSSPGATCDSTSSTSAYPSDDEDIPHPVPTRNLSLPGPDQSPALSQTHSISTNSSLVSLPLPPPLWSFDHNTYPSPMAASSSEKAIAALTLAIGNGAAGLDDYEALRAIQLSPALDEVGQVGELWH